MSMNQDVRCSSKTKTAGRNVKERSRLANRVWKEATALSFPDVRGRAEEGCLSTQTNTWRENGNLLVCEPPRLGYHHDFEASSSSHANRMIINNMFQQILSNKPYHLLSKITTSLLDSLSHFPLGISVRNMNSVTDSVNAANQSLQDLVSNGGFDRVMEKVSLCRQIALNSTDFPPQVKVVSVGPGRVTAEVLLDKSHLNRGGFAHGGFLATLVDSISTLAVIFGGDPEATINPGVSIDLNVQFMAPANNNSTLVIEVETLRKGQSIAFLAVNILNKQNRRLIARGSHIKFVATPKL